MIIDINLLDNLIDSAREKARSLREDPQSMARKRADDMARAHDGLATAAGILRSHLANWDDVSREARERKEAMSATA